MEVAARSKKIGANFCQVRNTKAIRLLRFTIITGPQKCIGAREDLRISPKSCTFLIKEARSFITLVRIVKEPTLWTMKYIMVTFLKFQVDVRSGRNDIKFNSIIIQTHGQLSDESDPIVPNSTPVHIYPFKSSVKSLIA